MTEPSQRPDRQEGRSDLLGPGDRARNPLPLETKVFSRLDGEPGTILNRVAADAYEVITDSGIEVWLEQDIQVVEED